MSKGSGPIGFANQEIIMTFNRPRTLKIVSASLLLVLIFVTIAKMVMFEIKALSSQRAHSSERVPQIDWSVYRQW
jgi:hypothetical protein